MLSFFFPDRLGASASPVGEAEAPMLLDARASSERRTAILDHYWDGGLAGGGVVSLAGGGVFGLGLVLGGGGGGFCSGAPPGCELGELAGGGLLGLVVVSLGGEFADPPGLSDC